MHLEISEFGQDWLSACNKTHFLLDPTFSNVRVSFVEKYQAELRKILAKEESLKGVRTKLSVLSTQEPRFFLSRWWLDLDREGLEAMRRTLDVDLLLLTAFVEAPLNKLQYHACQLGAALQKWLRVYNHLVEGIELGQLSETQVQSLKTARPLLQGAINYFERCARLHRWHETHQTLSGSVPDTPMVGLKLEDLNEIVACLTEAVSEETLDKANTIVEQEVALIELQRQLGALPALIGAEKSSF